MVAAVEHLGVAVAEATVGSCPRWSWCPTSPFISVVARTARGLDRYLDLGDAFEAFQEAERPEWRVHFHVPIFLAELDGFATTRPTVETFLAHQRRAPVTRHLEVETYTWDVLPEEHRRDDVVTNIVKEMQWAHSQLRKS